MPADRSHYPVNWKEISVAIRKRADNRCECVGECGLHGPKADDPDGCLTRRCQEPNGEPARWARGKVILTTAHLNAVGGPCKCAPLCGDPLHLKAMCQRCHLRYDHELHQRNAKATRRSRKAMGELFE